MAIKVLSDENVGFDTDFIAGLQFALSQFQASGKPGVVTMSISGGIFTSLDDAVRNVGFSCSQYLLYKALTLTKKSQDCRKRIAHRYRSWCVARYRYT